MIQSQLRSPDRKFPSQAFCTQMQRGPLDRFGQILAIAVALTLSSRAYSAGQEGVLAGWNLLYRSSGSPNRALFLTVGNGYVAVSYTHLLRFSLSIVVAICPPPV